MRHSKSGEHLYDLLLKQRHRHAECAVQRVGEQRVVVLPGFAGAAGQVGVHGAALDRARSDERDLDHQVVELPRLQPRQRGELGAGFDLKHPTASSPGATT
jgi:hypothetical protein